MNRKKKRDGITRRQFLKSASIGAGVISLGKVNLSESAQLPNAARREKCDVVVIGTGLAALSAAIEATSQGAKVVVLEKVSRDKSGGNSRLSAGIIATPSENTKEARDGYYEDFIKKSMGKGDPELTRLLADRVLDGVDWLKAQGMEFTPSVPVAGLRGKWIDAAPGLFKGMPKTIEKLLDVLEKHGAKVAYETKAKELIMDSRGKVNGVKVSRAPLAS